MTASREGVKTKFSGGKRRTSHRDDAIRASAARPCSVLNRSALSYSCYPTLPPAETKRLFPHNDWLTGEVQLGFCNSKKRGVSLQFPPSLLGRGVSSPGEIRRDRAGSALGCGGLGKGTTLGWAPASSVAQPSFQTIPLPKACFFFAG